MRKLSMIISIILISIILSIPTYAGTKNFCEKGNSLKKESMHSIKSTGILQM